MYYAGTIRYDTPYCLGLFISAFGIESMYLSQWPPMQYTVHSSGVERLMYQSSCSY